MSKEEFIELLKNKGIILNKLSNLINILSY